MNRIKCILATVCLFLLIFSSVQLLPAPQYKDAKKAYTAGNYDRAVILLAEKLRKKPKHKKSVKLLIVVLPVAYERHQFEAEEAELRQDWDKAMNEYYAISKLSREIRSIPPVMKPKTKPRKPIQWPIPDISAKLRDTIQKSTDKHYIQAEDFFNNGEFKRAIEEYSAALNLTKPYKDSREKIAESYYCIASDSEQRGNYRYAAKNHEKALETVGGYKDSLQRAATLYYALGCYFLSEGHCRKALEDLLRTKAINPQYRDLNEKIAAAKDGATVRIAFVRFDNPTGRNLAGMALGDFIFETIKTKVQYKASEFIRMIEREEVLVLAREQNISEGLLSNESTVPVNIEGVNYLIFGKLNQVRDVHAGLSETPMNAEYEYWYYVSYTDKNGRQKKRKEWKKAPMYFSLFKDKLSVALAGVIRVVETKTGAVVINHQISEEAIDKIAFADEFRAAHKLTASNVYFDKEIKEFAGARRELKDVDTLAKQMINSIATKMSAKILYNLDRIPNVSDPTTLKY